MASLPGIPIVVAPTTGTALGTGSHYAQALAEALAARDIFASTHNPASQSYLLQTTFVQTGFNARLIRPNGLTVGHWHLDLTSSLSPKELADRLAATMTGQAPPSPSPSASTDAPAPGSQAEAAQVAINSGQRTSQPSTNKQAKNGRLAKPSFVVGTIEGAPGDGAAALRTALTRILATAGFKVQPKPGKDSLAVTLAVTVGPVINSAQRVKLVWTVAAPTGKILGSVTQENDVPAGSLAPHWGPVASAAAIGGAQGVLSIAAQAAQRQVSH